MLKTQGLTPVTTEQGLAVARKMGAQYMECSAKEMRGVEEIFERAILTVVANDRKTLEAEALASSSGNDKSGEYGSRRRSTTLAGITFGSDGVPIPVVKKKKRKCALV
jgi:Ras family protein A